MPSQHADEDVFRDIAAELEKIPEPEIDVALEDWIAFALFWALAFIVFLQFFTRYVLNDSLAWTEEIARYVLMALAFLGAPMAARRGTHIAVEFFLDMLPRAPRHLARLAVHAVTVLFFGLATYLCWQVAEIMQTQFMVVIDWPLSIVFYACMAGLFLTTLRSAQRLVLIARTPEPEAAPDPSLGVRL